jgi:hypothetical protein
MDSDTRTQNLEDWYSAAEAARRLSERRGKPVRASYLYKLLEYGKLRSIKVGSARSRSKGEPALAHKTKGDAALWRLCSHWKRRVP